MTIPVRLWLHRLRFRRHISSHPLRDAWEQMQARMEGLELELPRPLPHYAEIIQLSDYLDRDQ